MNAAIRQIGRPAAVLRAAARPGRRLVREQGLVAGAQLAAGVGNLAFALIAARLLAPGAFAQLVAFLALYLLIHVPASSLSAGSALTPALAARGRRRALRWGLVGGAAVAVAAPPLASVANVPAALLIVLAGAVPLAPWLALERGRLYGAGRHRRAAASLAVEPAVRLALGLPLAIGFGAVGGAIGVVLGGCAALALTRPARADVPTPPATAVKTRAGGAPAMATAAFLVLAMLQNQDVVLANGLLPAAEAGRFAVLSTLGGIAAFATTTVPLVLLPRAAGRERGALAAALATAALLGGAAILAVALVPEALVGAAFGERYASVGPLAVPYVAAMALFGVARVFVAQHCARGGGRALVVIIAAVAAGQTLALVLAGDDAASVSAITVVTMGALAVATALPALLRLRGRDGGGMPAAARTRARPRPRGGRTTHAAGDLVALAVLIAVAIALRLAATRGIWLDEATGISQAQMPLDQMLAVLRSTDVHPPLHHLMLWGIAHAFGTSEFAMRAPSLAAGAALIGVLYLLGHELYDRRAGLLAAALGTVAPFLVWYSQEARMYALLMLFATLAMYAQVLVLRRGRPRHWALYAVATVALLWTQYFGALFVAVQQAGFLVAADSRRRAGRPNWPFARAWLGSLALIAVAVAPIIPFALDQFQANQAAGRGFNAPANVGGDVSELDESAPGIYSLLTNLAWGVGGYHSNATMAAVSALWPLGLLGCLLALGRQRRPMSLLVLACALLPALALFAVGFAKPFLFEIRYFAATVPLLLVLLARGATGWVRATAATVALSAVLVGTLAVAAADQQVNRSNPRMYDFGGALAQLQHRMRPGDVLLYQPAHLDDLIEYYEPGLRAAPLADGIPARRDARRVFLLASFLNERQHARATGRGLAQLRDDWKPRNQFERPQVRVWEFGK